MAANIGALTVSLGLDAADYTRALTKAEKDAYAFGESIGNGIRTAAVGATAALAALGVSASGAVAGFNALIDGASKFSDLADKTGASAEALASFGVAAGTSGVSIDKIATATNALTRNLVGVGDETKAAGAALAALGIPIKDFKTLAPEAQIEKLSKTLATFKDGAGKSAAAMALLGKSGAEILPFLKTLEEQGGRQVILTQEMIDKADEYGDRQAKAKAELQLYAQALATQAIPYVTAFTGALTDTIKELLGVGKGATDLKNNTAIADFAENAVSALGFVIDAADGVTRLFRVVGTSIGGAAAAAAAAASGEFSQAKSIMADIGDQVDNILLAPQFGEKLRQRIAEAKKAIANTSPPDKRPDVKYGGATPKGKKDTSAVQEAKAQLASDLQAIKEGQSAITNTYNNQEKVLDALRAAGLRDEGQYYAEKGQLAAQAAASQEAGLQAQIARMQQEQLSGKDAIENAKKIATAEAELTKVRESAATAATVLGIQAEAATNRIAASLLSARQAAQDFFDTTNKGYDTALAGIGQGSKARDFASAIQQIEEKYQQQRRDLQNQRSQAELAGSFGPDAQRQYDQQLEIINTFQGKAVQSYKDYYAKLDASAKDWSTGASEALKNYADEAANTAKLTSDVFAGAFKGLEDTLVDFITTGKGSFKDLIDSILKDVARLVVKQQITGPLAELLGGALGGKSAGSGSGFLSTFADWIFGKKANGGPVSAGGLYQVSENRPEMLDVNGKSFLMMGSQRGNIDPNPSMGGGGTVIQNFTVGDVATVGMLKQALAASQAKSAQALSRSQRYGGAFAG